jgi:hypothetical protein
LAKALAAVPAEGASNRDKKRPLDGGLFDFLLFHYALRGQTASSRVMRSK